MAKHGESPSRSTIAPLSERVAVSGSLPAIHLSSRPSAIPSAYLGRITTRELAARRRRPPTLISIFSGCGGFALGAHMAGFEVRVFVENDQSCVDTLRLNWLGRGRRKPIWECRQRRPPAILQADITKVEAYEILQAADLAVGGADCLEGGFPCQGFSTAGRRLLDDPRNRLYQECVRVIRGTLPRMFVLENVPGLVSMAKGAVIRQICEDLAVSGYNVKWDIFDAADYGVPQRRRRVFFFGERVDVATLQPSGRMGLHMAAFTGQVHHPDWFLKKYPKSKEVA